MSMNAGIDATAVTSDDDGRTLYPDDDDSYDDDDDGLAIVEHENRLLSPRLCDVILTSIQPGV